MAYNWDLVEKIFKKATGVDDVKTGVAKLEEVWRKNKGWMLPLFDENGRRHAVVGAAVSNEEIKAAYNEGMRIAEVLSSNPRYSKVMYQDRGRAAATHLKSWLTANATISEIVTNKLDEKKSDPSREGRTLPKGTKLTKYYSAYVQSNNGLWADGGTFNHYGRDNATLVSEFLIDVYSQLISIIKRSEDHIVVSINPVDMLYCSYHTTNWRSCHNVYDGEHRTGSLSFMLDGCTAVAFCYRKEDIDPQLGVPWPRKIWRQMIFLDQKRLGAFFGREYTTNNQVYSKVVRGIAGHILADFSGKEPKWKVKGLSMTYSSETDSDTQSTSTDALTGNGWHYRDSPLSAIRLTDGGEYPRLKAGIVDMPCVACGATRTNTGSHNKHICPACDPIPRCFNCSRELGDDGEAYSDDVGHYFCPNCWSRMYTQCHECGEWTRNEFMKDVEGGHKVCLDCHDRLYIPCEHCGVSFHRSNIIETVDHAKYCKGCIKKVAVKCDLCGSYHKSRENITLTKDGYKVCANCVEHLKECTSCGAKYMYAYTMIGSVCHDCAMKSMASGMEQTKREVASA